MKWWVVVVQLVEAQTDFMSWHVVRLVRRAPFFDISDRSTMVWKWLMTDTCIASYVVIQVVEKHPATLDRIILRSFGKLLESSKLFPFVHSQNFNCAICHLLRIENACFFHLSLSLRLSQGEANWQLTRMSGTANVQGGPPCIILKSDRLRLSADVLCVVYTDDWCNTVVDLILSGTKCRCQPPPYTLTCTMVITLAPDSKQRRQKV